MAKIMRYVAAKQCGFYISELYIYVTLVRSHYRSRVYRPATKSALTVLDLILAQAHGLWEQTKPAPEWRQGKATVAEETHGC